MSASGRSLFLAGLAHKVTESFAGVFTLEVGFIDEDVVSVVHAIELKKLIYQLKADQGRRQLMNFLAAGVFPVEGRTLALWTLLFFDDLVSKSTTLKTCDLI